MKILLTDGEQRSTLAAVRSLGRAGHELGVAGPSAAPLAGASRYCARCHTLEKGRPVDIELERWVDEYGYEMVIPMTDQSVEDVLRLRDRRADLKVPFATTEAFLAISDKQRLLAVAAELGLPVPAQHVADSSAGFEAAMEWASDRGFDVVLKPARSAVETEGETARFAVSLVGSETDFRRSFEGYPRAAFPLLIQERIQGPGRGAFLLMHQGTTCAVFAHERIREKPPGGGVSVYRKSAELDAKVQETAEAVLKAFEWHGVAMVEFKEDARTGELYLMEVNGRFWGSLQLAIDAGVDFPKILAECFTNGVPLTPQPYRVGVRSRWLWGDFDHLLGVLRMSSAERKRYPALKSRLGTLVRFLLPWRPGDRWEVLRISDPKPFLRESRQWISALR